MLLGLDLSPARALEAQKLFAQKLRARFWIPHVLGMETNQKAAILKIGGHRADSQGRYTQALVSSEDKSFGQFKWSIHSNGYAYRLDRKSGRAEIRYLHREVMGLKRGQGVVDHINGDPLDCRRENLRVLESNALNLQNRKSGHGASTYRGVYRNKKNGKWIAQVNTGGQRLYGGSFQDEQEAALMAEVLRRRCMPYARPDQRLQAEFGDRLEQALAEIAKRLK